MSGGGSNTNVVMSCDSDDSCTADRDDNTKYYCSVTSGRCTQYPIKKGLPVAVIVTIIGILVSLVYIYYKWWFFLFSIKEMSEEEGKLTTDERASKEKRLLSNRRMAIVMGIALLLVVGASIYGMVVWSRSSQPMPDCSQQPKQQCAPITQTQVCNPSTGNEWQCVDLLNPCPGDSEFNGACGGCVPKCDNGKVIDAKCTKCVDKISDANCNVIGTGGAFMPGHPISDSQKSSEFPMLSSPDGSQCIDYTDPRISPEDAKARLDTVCKNSQYDFYCGGKCQMAPTGNCDELDAVLPFRVSSANPDWLKTCPLVTKKRTGDVEGNGVVCAKGQCSDPTYRDFLAACIMDENGCPPSTVYNSDKGKCLPIDANGSEFSPIQNLKGCRPAADASYYQLTSDSSGALCQKRESVQYNVDTKQTTPALISGNMFNLTRLGVSVAISGVSDPDTLRSLRYYYYILDIDSETKPVLPKTIDIDTAQKGKETITLRFSFVPGSSGVVHQPTSASDTSPTQIVFENLTYQIQSGFEQPFSLPQVPVGQPVGPVKAFRLFMFVTDDDNILKYVSSSLLGTTMATCVDPQTLLVALQLSHDDTMTDSLMLVPNRLISEEVVSANKDLAIDIWGKATQDSGDNKGESCIDCRVCPVGQEGDECRVLCQKQCFDFKVIENTSDKLAYAVVPCNSAAQCYLAGKYMLVVLAWEMPSGIDEPNMRFYVMREQLTYMDLTHGRRLIVGETLKDAENKSNASVDYGTTDPQRRNAVVLQDPRPGSTAGKTIKVFYTIDVAEVEAVITYSVGVWDVSKGGTEWIDAKVRSPLVNISVQVPPYTADMCLSIVDPVHTDAPFYTLSSPVDDKSNTRAPRYCEPAVQQTGAKEFYCLLKGYYNLSDGQVPPLQGKAVDDILADIKNSSNTKSLMMYSDFTKCKPLKRTDYLTDVTENGRPLLTDDQYQSLMRYDDSGGIGSDSQCIAGLPLVVKLQCGAVTQSSYDANYNNVVYPRTYPLGESNDPKLLPSLDPAVEWGDGHLHFVSDVSDRVNDAVTFSASYLKGTSYEPKSLDDSFETVKGIVYSCPDANDNDFKMSDDKSKQRVDALMKGGTSIPRGTAWIQSGSTSAKDLSAYMRSLDWLPPADTSNGDLSKFCCNSGDNPNAQWKNLGSGKGGSCECNAGSQEFADKFRCKRERKKYRCAITNLPQRTPRPYKIDKSDNNNTDIPSRGTGLTWERFLWDHSMPTYACVPDDNGAFTADDCMKGVCYMQDPDSKPVPGVSRDQLDSDHHPDKVALDKQLPLWPPEKLLANPKSCQQGYVLVTKADGSKACEESERFYENTTINQHCGVTQCTSENNAYCSNDCSKDGSQCWTTDLVKVSDGGFELCAYWAHDPDVMGEKRLKYGPPFTSDYFKRFSTATKGPACFECWGDDDLKGLKMVFDDSKEKDFPFRAAIGSECDNGYNPVMNCTYLPRSDIPEAGGKTLGICGGGDDKDYDKDVPVNVKGFKKQSWTVEKNANGKRCRRKVDGDYGDPTDMHYKKLYCENIPVCA